MTHRLREAEHEYLVQVEATAVQESLAGFIRINPSTAPLTPPGAAPTLTTIYQTNSPHLPSEFKSQSSSTNSSKITTATSSSGKKTTKRKPRLRWSNGKPTPASAGIKGTAKEKKRMQEIADSLDLGLEVEEGKMAARKRVGGAGHALDREPSRVVGLGDVRLQRRESVVVEAGGSAGHALGEPNRVVSDGDWRLERRRRENVAMVLPVGKRRSVG